MPFRSYTPIGVWFAFSQGTCMTVAIAWTLMEFIIWLWKGLLKLHRKAMPLGLFMSMKIKWYWREGAEFQTELCISANGKQIEVALLQEEYSDKKAGDSAYYLLVGRCARLILIALTQTFFSWIQISEITCLKESRPSFLLEHREGQ